MTMYALKPIISMPAGDIYKPKTMYEMKNIHGQRGHDDTSNHTLRSHGSRVVSDIAEQVIKFLKVSVISIYSIKRNPNIARNNYE